MNNNKIEKISLEFIGQFLPNNPVIIEAGANIGRDSIKLAKKFPLSTIYSFEPVPELYEQLKIKTQDYKNIKTFNIALCDQNKNITFNVCKNIGAISSLLTPTQILEKFPNAEFEEKKVECINLDSWIIRNGISRVDFMWLDLQGAELLALQNCPKIMSIVKAVQIEVNLVPRYTNMPLYEDIKNFFESHNFKIAKESLHHTTWGDVLFVKS